MKNDKVITNDWNYDTSYMQPSLPVLILENFKSFAFPANCILDLKMAHDWVY
jgi:hypothetical protein